MYTRVQSLSLSPVITALYVVRYDQRGQTGQDNLPRNNAAVRAPLYFHPQQIAPGSLFCGFAILASQNIFAPAVDLLTRTLLSSVAALNVCDFRRCEPNTFLRIIRRVMTLRAGLAHGVFAIVAYEFNLIDSLLARRRAVSPWAGTPRSRCWLTSRSAAL